MYRFLCICMRTAALSSAKRGYISQNIDSTNSNVFVIIGSGIGTNTSNTFASLQWRETR